MVDDATAYESAKLLVEQARDSEAVLRARPRLCEERLEVLSHHLVQHGSLLRRSPACLRDRWYQSGEHIDVLVCSAPRRTSRCEDLCDGGRRQPEVVAELSREEK